MIVYFEFLTREPPAVLHFTKNQIIQPRPWVKGCTHPYNAYYLKAKADTVLAEMELWDANRGLVNKAAYELYTHGSKKVLAHLLGYIHSYLYPMFLYKWILR